MVRGCRIKLVVLGISLVALQSSPVWAGGPFSFGVKGGVGLATLNDDFAYESKTGPSGGLFADYSFSDVFGVQGEVLYVPRGASLGESDARGPSGEDLGSFETFLNRDDLDIGLRARVMPARGGKIEPYFLAGPTLALELNEELAVSPPILGLAENVSSSVLEDVAFNIAFGLGGEIAIGSGHGLLEINYDLGLTDLSENVLVGSVHSSTWRFLAGYRF